MQKAPETLSNLMCFILNVKTIEGTQIRKYIEIATKEKAPEIYKPRKGKVNNNLDKYTEDNLNFIAKHGGKVLSLFGYEHLFIKTKEGEKPIEVDENEILAGMREHNEKNLIRSI